MLTFPFQKIPFLSLITGLGHKVESGDWQRTVNLIWLTLPVSVLWLVMSWMSVFNEGQRHKNLLCKSVAKIILSFNLPEEGSKNPKYCKSDH